MKEKLPALAPEVAWGIIGRMGWNNSKKNDYAAIAQKFFQELGAIGMKRLERFVFARASDLYSAVEKYEQEHGDLEVGSDDGFSDLRYHVVGMGKVAFEMAMEDPKLLQTRYRAGLYQESFAYCFLEPDPPRTQEDKDRDFEKLVAAIKVARKDLDKAHNIIQALWAELNSIAVLADTVKKDRETA